VELPCPIEQWWQEGEEDIILEVFLVVANRKVETVGTLAEQEVRQLALVVMVVVLVVRVRFPVVALEPALARVLVDLRHKAVLELVEMHSTSEVEEEEVTTAVEAAAMLLVEEEGPVIVPRLIALLQVIQQDINMVLVM
jgi:hypothetical protein